MKQINFRGYKVKIYSSLRPKDIEPKYKKGFRIYEIRHSANDWSTPVTIEKKVYANFWGTLLSNKTLKEEFYSEKKKEKFIQLARIEAERFR